MRKTKHFYNGQPLICWCRENGVSYNYVLEIRRNYFKRRRKELPVEKAVDKIKNREFLSKKIYESGVAKKYYPHVMDRIIRGWSFEKAVNTPIHRKNRLVDLKEEN